MAPGSLVFTENSALPDSFRYDEWKQRNNRTTFATDGYVRIPTKNKARERLDGDYFLLDSFYPGHFGHHMTETASRLWAWDEAKHQFPELKALFSRAVSDQRDEPFERLTFEAFGIRPHDIVEVRHPVEVRSLVAAPNLWHNQPPHFAHPEMRTIWTRITDTLAEVPEEHPERIFVSRRETKRSVHNIRDVEAYFERHGFVVIYPEDHSLARRLASFDTRASWRAWRVHRCSTFSSARTSNISSCWPGTRTPRAMSTCSRPYWVAD